MRMYAVTQHIAANKMRAYGARGLVYVQFFLAGTNSAILPVLYDNPRRSVEDDTKLLVIAAVV